MHGNSADLPVISFGHALPPALAAICMWLPVGMQPCPAQPCRHRRAPSAYDTIMDPMTMLTTSFMLAPAPTSPAAQGG